jgi:hypothetical protein
LLCGIMLMLWSYKREQRWHLSYYLLTANVSPNIKVPFLLNS